ncbi:MBL fold metallo-hydrolase [Xylanibacillus composti]|uniref:MBL fold hydrolase n=1 Tax=Xylanibacillus composti TaxID=1572762 RepID=A0A8J4H0B3_9BACL|nr:MBL fold metallo-hydrolase [Xylanibacillus composti]MDT9723412.1 MBL fold metallo-hydrolase [Xylanibacillus composti]GIQ68552.1 MBL fold hydrolase [Xylanibacillus composti]
MSTATTADTFFRQIQRLKVPVPFPLRWVNSYIIRGQEGYTILDPGLHTEAAREAWQAWLKEQRIAMRDIRQIVLTHHHPDHYGLSGWFQEASGAPVYMSGKGYNQVKQLWHEPYPMNAGLLACYREHGMDEATLEQVEANMRGFIDQVTPQPGKVELLEPGQTLMLGDHVYELMETHGHAYGHLSFYQREHQALFCGDHVLPVITPNVSYLPGLDENPLLSFMESLQRMAALQVRQAFPGHRDPFQHFRERTLELIGHHEERLAHIAALRKSGMTAYELCRELFGTRLSIHQLRFAMGETIAHLVYLDKRPEPQ